MQFSYEQLTILQQKFVWHKIDLCRVRLCNNGKSDTYLDKCDNFLQINDISIMLSAKNLVLSVSSSNLNCGFKLNATLSIEVGWCLSKQIKC